MVPGGERRSRKGKRTDPAEMLVLCGRLPDHEGEIIC